IRDFHVTGVQTCALPISFPENGRVVVGGCLLVSGEPLARTAIRRDPVAPVHDSSLVTLLARQSRRPVHYVGVDVLDEGVDALAEIGRASCRGRGWIAGGE